MIFKQVHLTVLGGSLIYEQKWLGLFTVGLIKA